MRVLKRFDRNQIAMKSRKYEDYKFDWDNFDYKPYFDDNHDLFKQKFSKKESETSLIFSKINPSNYGYFTKHYGIKARFFRVWTWNTSILKWKYRRRLYLFNRKGVKPYQHLFDSNDFFLKKTALRPESGNKVLSLEPFSSFNKWVRTLLLFYRPEKILTEERNARDWLEFILLLNFKRYRFFPSIRSKKKPSFVTLSLGLFRRFTRRSRAWTKTRMSYLLAASFLRKILMYTKFTTMFLFVNRVPKHLTSILHTIQSPALQIYEYPFANFKRDKKTKKFIYSNGKMEFNTPDSSLPLEYPTVENESTYQVQFPFIVFTNSKAYAPTKKKKRGSIKRHNLKKIILLNRIPEYL